MGAIKKIRYNCHKATLLIEKKLIDKITFGEEIGLRIHLVGCSVCRIFGKQSHMINKMVQQLFHSANNSDLHLDDNLQKGSPGAY